MKPVSGLIDWFDMIYLFMYRILPFLAKDYPPNLTTSLPSTRTKWIC
jgi:hypothetical protein